jgi:hypothetical protein
MLIQALPIVEENDPRSICDLLSFEERSQIVAEAFGFGGKSGPEAQVRICFGLEYSSSR